MIMYRYLKTIMYRYLKTEGNHVTSQVTTPQYLYLPSFELLYRLPDTILEKDHPMTIPSKFGSN
jgi:hypothetical protein